MTFNELLSKVIGEVFPGAPEETIAVYAGEVSELVDPVLEALAREVADSRQLRHYLLTDPNTTTATLDVNGKCDLASLITSKNILLDKLKHGEITPDNALPLEWFNSRAHASLDGALDDLFLGCWLEATVLKTKNTEAALLSGDLSLRVPFIPTLAQLPSALAGRFLAMMIERFRTGRNAGDANDDE
jgi:hypothetical protein